MEKSQFLQTHLILPDVPEEAVRSIGLEDKKLLSINHTLFNQDTHKECVREKPGVLVIHYYFNEKIEVQATLSALESIFLNLIDNAIKYSPEHGQILIKLFEQSDGILVEIHDSGRGIAPEQYDHVMQRFVRLMETQSQIVGSGLGLSIVKSALESIHAHIQLDRSEVLNGLKIKLYFNL